jgi:hypothetical protein
MSREAQALADLDALPSRPPVSVPLAV